MVARSHGWYCRGGTKPSQWGELVEAMDTGRADDSFVVVVNHEEQYSVWPANRELPAGWHPEGTRGTRDECLSHIDDIWTDITPKSVRERLATERA